MPLKLSISFSNQTKSLGDFYGICAKSHITRFEEEVREVLASQLRIWIDLALMLLGISHYPICMIHTVFYQIEPLKNGGTLILPSIIARNSSEPNVKRIFEILWGIVEIIQFIPSEESPIF